MAEIHMDVGQLLSQTSENTKTFSYLYMYDMCVCMIEVDIFVPALIFDHPSITVQEINAKKSTLQKLQGTAEVAGHCIFDYLRPGGQLRH